MPRVRVTGKVAAPAATVWRFAGDFDGLPNWIPGILKSRKEGSGVGQLRHLEIKWKGPRWAIERQESRDDERFVLTYSIVDTTLPVRDYLSTFRLVPSADGKSCTLDWSAEFQAKDATDAESEAFVQGAYGAGLASLQKKYGS